MFENIPAERINNALKEADRVLSLDEKVSRSLGSQDLSIVTYDAFKKLEECKWFHVNKEVKYMLIDNQKPVLFLRTIVDSRIKQGQFGWHFHDCWELIEVRKGSAIIGGIEIKEGQKVILAPNAKHNPKGKFGEITDVDVYFSKEPFENIKNAIFII